MTYQPALDQGRFMGGVIVHHDMDLMVRQSGCINLVKEFPEFNGAMALMACSQDLAGPGVESSEKGCSPMARVVVSSSFDLSWAHREQWLHAIKSLDLGFLIHTKNNCLVGRVQVQPNDIPHFLNEERIGRKFETLRTMWLENECPPDAAYYTLAQSRPSCHRSSAPMSGFSRHSLQSESHYPFYISISDLPRCTGSCLVQQAIKPLFQKTSTPFPYSMAANSQFTGYDAIALACGATQHKASSLGKSLACLGSSDPAFQSLALLYSQYNRWNWPSSTHISSRSFSSIILEGDTYVYN